MVKAVQVTPRPRRSRALSAPKTMAKDRLLIIGIGASVGGLGAFKSFFRAMPPKSGMAFVLVQHLAPHYKSILTELVRAQTAMAVVEAQQDIAVLANHVYIIPPDSTLTIKAGCLQLQQPAPPRNQRFPIDSFFISLAGDQGANAVCVVLSGTGADGTKGLRAVKAAGGMTLAQAGTDHTALMGMPESAAATGLVDRVLPVEDMAEFLVRYAASRNGEPVLPETLANPEQITRQLSEITALLRAALGHDFSGYKHNTVLRRIQHRMQLLGITGLPGYIAHLQQVPAELPSLFQELLISVTQFFRDPRAFEALSGPVLRTILDSKGAMDAVRIWVPGCATGEEVYSLAILVREALDARGLAPKVQIFGTDIDQNAIAVARTGWYAEPALGLSADRKARWFVAEGDGIRAIKPIREMCIFSLHNLIKDPPFSRLDLISCRNLLIYLGAELQEKVIRLFQYSLRPDGVLFLGPSEGVTRSARLFSVIDAKFHLFRRRDTLTPLRLPAFDTDATVPPPMPRPQQGPGLSVEARIDDNVRAILERHSPAWLVVNRQYEIIRFSGGQAGRYLEPSAGMASLGLFGILRKALRPTVRAGLELAFTGAKAPPGPSLRLKIEAETRLVTVLIEPIKTIDTHPDYCVVAFQDQGVVQDYPLSSPSDDPGDAKLQILEDELYRAKEQLQAAIDAGERASEETRSSAEEYHSVNEELQSANEELETAKEEMQSINEELHTVNVELSDKNAQLIRANSDLENILESTEIATIFLDTAMCIKGFTPPVRVIFHLRDSDHGRPITEIASRLAYTDLAQDIRLTLDQLTVTEREVRIRETATVFRMRIRPYYTVDRVVDGVVITLVDITEHRQIETVLREHAALVEFSPDAMIGLSLDGRIRLWNPGAVRLYGYQAEQAIGLGVGILSPDSGRAEQDRMLALALAGSVAGPVELTHRHQNGTELAIDWTVMPIRNEAGMVTGLATTARDVHERREAETHRALLLHELTHRVKNALASVQSLALESLRKADSLSGFREIFMARLVALSNTHNLLTRGEWHGAVLSDILTVELAPYQNAGGDRWTISGPRVALTPKTALAMGVAFHELATNAAKYGALSTEQGHVAVSWRTRQEGAQPVLDLDWCERDGPPVATPQKTGFGTRLLREGLAYELDGKVDVLYNPGGIAWHLTIPLNPVEDFHDVSASFR